MKHLQTILVIDDSEDIYYLVRARLATLDVEIKYCDDGERALTLAHRHPPDLILLDVAMPGVGGFEVCRRLKQDSVTREVPVIFLTGSDDPQAKVHGFEAGAVDYVTKPFHPAELKARVRSALRTQLLIDILESQARTDSLTGLANRKGFIESLDASIERMKERDHNFAVLFMDLDRFKAINDTHGHEIGDELLVRVARLLCESVRTERVMAEGYEHDVIARMGGDEFVILLEDIEDAQVARRIAQRVENMLAKPLEIDGHDVSVGVSVGIRFSGPYEGRSDDLLRDADAAMYEAKEAGRGRIVMFEAGRTPTAAASVERGSRRLVRSDEIGLRYHPIVDLTTGQVVALEVSTRWNNTMRRLAGTPCVSICDDKHVSGEGEQAVKSLTEWMMYQACSDFASWVADQTVPASLKLHVNMPRRQWLDADVPVLIHQVLQDVGMSADRLVVELPESQFLCEPTAIWPMVEQVRAMGAELALDHFGKDTASLISLQRFPLDMVKIDRSFVRCITYSRSFTAMVEAIVSLGWNLGLTIVADGIDSADQVAKLQGLDCTLGQGPLFGEALKAAEMPEFLQRVAEAGSAAWVPQLKAASA
ncbi:EAL domain-containing protein [Planctomycetales bacterium ZRK34]|nr:EAL domain-containing protein [Planctomycetales bacterium ZRK34]